MRGYDVVELRRRLLALLEGGGGMTGSEIAREMGISRVTMSRHLESFASAGVLRRRRAGNATLWSAPDASARFEFPADYARAASEYAAAVLALDPDRAAAIVAACVAHGAAPAPMAGEVLVPAIEAARRAYADGKAGRAEAALMRGAISSSMALMRGEGGREPTRHAVIMADSADGALRAEAAAAAMRREGWRAMPIGDISASIDALLDTDLERLLVRARAPRGGITAALALSETAAGLRTTGRIVRSACRGAARGTLLCLCGPEGHGVDADASVRGPADAVHWAASL